MISDQHISSGTKKQLGSTWWIQVSLMLKKALLSEAYKNQGFIYQKRVIGLQFHLEMSKRTIRGVIGNCRNELIEGKYIQNEEEMLDKNSFLADPRLLMFTLLDNLEGTIGL